MCGYLRDRALGRLPSFQPSCRQSLMPPVSRRETPWEGMEALPGRLLHQLSAEADPTLGIWRVEHMHVLARTLKCSRHDFRNHSHFRTNCVCIRQLGSQHVNEDGGRARLQFDSILDVLRRVDRSQL